MKGDRRNVSRLVRLSLIRGVAFLMVLAASSVNLSCVAGASELPQAVTIDELLQLLRERSPRLVAERAQIDVAAADLIAAEVLPNPSISYGSTNVVGGKKNTLFEGNLQQQSTIEVPLLIAGQRSARRSGILSGAPTGRLRPSAHQLLFGDSARMYIGPDSLMPVASAFAAVAGFLLMFWRRVVAAIRLIAQRLFARR